MGNQQPSPKYIFLFCFNQKKKIYMDAVQRLNGGRYFILKCLRYSPSPPKGVLIGGLNLQQILRAY